MDDVFTLLQSSSVGLQAKGLVLITDRIPLLDRSGVQAVTMALEAYTQRADTAQTKTILRRVSTALALHPFGHARTLLQSTANEIAQIAADAPQELCAAFAALHTLLKGKPLVASHLFSQPQALGPIVQQTAAGMRQFEFRTRVTSLELYVQLALLGAHHSGAETPGLVAGAALVALVSEYIRDGHPKV
ncbi:hypothetical protein H4R35_007376, partial [Dimargaris xerosporica]